MIPPSFSDLGKAAKDLFEKNFKFGKIALDVKSKSKQGVELNVKGDHITKEGKLAGSFESVYIWNNGLKSTMKWDTTNKLFSTLSVENIVKDGSKLSADATFHPDSGEKTLKTTASFKREYVNTSLVADFRSLSPVITPNIVLGCSEDRGYVAGGQMAWDTSRMALARHMLAVGYQTKELVLMGSLTNLTDVEALVYQRLTPEVELGVKINWATKSRDPSFGVCGKYQFDKTSFVKAKIDNTSRLGLAYGFKARDNVDITLSTELDGKNLEAGAHKFGVELCYSV